MTRQDGAVDSPQLWVRGARDGGAGGARGRHGRKSVGPDLAGVCRTKLGGTIKSIPSRGERRRDRIGAIYASDICQFRDNYRRFVTLNLTGHSLGFHPISGVKGVDSDSNNKS